MSTRALHLVQRAFFPAKLSATRSLVWQSGQVKVIGIIRFTEKKIAWPVLELSKQQGITKHRSQLPIASPDQNRMPL